MAKVIDKMEKMKKDDDISYRDCAKATGINYSTLMRMKGRKNRGETLIDKAGPKKVEQLDLFQFQRDLERLEHGAKRSSGVGELYLKHSASLSRREVAELVADARRDHNIFKKEESQRVAWRRPGIVWAFDDAEKKVEANGSKVFMDNIIDLASSYKFQPLAGSKIPTGENLAGHLTKLFHRHDAPLFIKRDNAGNLNHSAVNHALETFMVIPINSPAYYPKYNGAVEHAQSEVKNELENHFPPYQNAGEMALGVEIAAHDRNHKPRRKLGYKNSCQVFFGPDRIKFSKRKRKEVFQWISDVALEIKKQGGDSVSADAAWRAACSAWLQQNGHIFVAKNGESVTPLISKSLP